MADVVKYQPSGLGGKTLEEALSEIVKRISDTRHPPATLEDTLTALGYTDVFGREMLLRAVRPTLREGGENYDLTQKRRWLRRSERWAKDMVESGKNRLDFERTTEHSEAIRTALRSGKNSEMVTNALASIADLIDSRVGKKFDAVTTQYLREDVGTIMSHDRQQQQELAVHRAYKESFDRQTSLLERQFAVIEKLVGGGEGSVPSKS